MRHFLFIVLGLTLSIPIHGQETAEKAPPPSSPKADSIRLKCILISDTEAKVVAMSEPAAGEELVVKDVPLLESSDFRRYAKPIIGMAITKETFGMLVNGIKAYARSHDRLVADVQFPSQSFASGVIRVSVVFGRYNNVLFKGNKWFSAATLENRMGVRPGDEVRLSVLNDAINWANQNPFRKIKVLVNDQLPDPTKADLIVNVAEEFPFRAALGIDNQGNNILGVYRFTASGQYGNLWGLDHELAYQFVTSDKPDVYQSHSLDYRIPLPWHHYLRFAAAYGLVTPSYLNDAFHLKGESLLTSAAYTAPMEFSWGTAEIGTSLDFKRSNNNLEYGGTAINNSSVDIFQLGIESAVQKRDKWGAWVFAANLNLSPGGIDNRNSHKAFATARVKSRAQYVYMGLQLQRLVNLPNQFQLFAKANLQLPSTNLQATESMAIGGANTVRGYEERIEYGDGGFTANVELQSPVRSMNFPKISRIQQPLLYRGIIFWDYGEVWNHSPIVEDVTYSPLESAGLGLRCSVGNSFNLQADYGWQLRVTHPRSQPEGGRLSVKATMTF